MLALLCIRPRRAVSSFQQSGQRTPFTRLAAIASPLPEPPSTMPRSHSPLATAFAVGTNEIGIIDRFFRVRAEIDDLVAQR